MPFVYMASFVCIAVSLLDRILNYSDSLVLFNSLMTIQNILLSVIIIKEYLMIYNIA